MTETAVGYLRQSVSRDRDTRDGGSVSIAFQLEALQRWCASNDTTLVAWHSDVDESGASATRAGLNAFIADCTTLKPAWALFWDLSRVSRNLQLFLSLFDALEQTGTQLVSVTEGTRHPAFIWKMLALIAEENRTRISQNITHGRREATKRGRYLGPKPLGYLRGEDGVLVIDPETAWVVEWIFARAMEGFTATAICRMANEQGIPTGSASRTKGNGTPGGIPLPAPEAAGDIGGSYPESNLSHWSHSTIVDVLRRPTYTGMVQSGRDSKTRYGKALGTVLAEAPHEPIIDRATWHAVQALLDARAHRSRRGCWHWLAGRVTCATCGGRLYYVDAYKAKENGSTEAPPCGPTGNAVGGDTHILTHWSSSTSVDGYRDRYWKCRNSYRLTFGEVNRACPATKHRIAARLLDQYALELMSEALRRAALHTDPIAVQRRIARLSGAQRVTARETLDRRLADLQAQRVRINDAIQMGVGDLADLAIRDRALVEAIDRGVIERAALPDPVTLPTIMSALSAVVRVWRDWAGMTDEQRAVVATETGLAVTVDLDAQRATLSFAPPFDTVFS